MRPGPPSGSGQASGYGSLAIRVQPADSTVLIDGERWAGPQGQERLLVEVPEGNHHVQIQKDGFDTFATDVTVRWPRLWPLFRPVIRWQFERLAPVWGNTVSPDGTRLIADALARVPAASRALDVTTDRVRSYIVNRQGSGAKNASIQKELAALKRAFNLAKQAGRITSTGGGP